MKRGQDGLKKAAAIGCRLDFLSKNEKQIIISNKKKSRPLR
jgi:hypothetical protein